MAISNPNQQARARSRSECSKRLTRALLAAGISGSLSLAACNRSPGGAADLNAQNAADHAARLTASAGDLRVKPEFADSLEGKDSAQVRQIADAAAAAIKADAKNQRGVWKNYLEQKSVAADLDTAAELLKKSINNAHFSAPALKSTVQAQLGATQLAEARLHLAAAENKLLELTEKAADLQLSAAYVNQLGAQAGVEEARAKGDKPADLSALQQETEKRKEAVEKTKQDLADIQKQISDKQEQASKIYADTDAAFAAAENMKGSQAIDAAKKAVEDRKQADALSEQAADLQPKLAEAQDAASTAAIELADAQSKLNSARSGNQQGEQRVKTANSQAAILHDQAKKLITGAESGSGLDAEFKSFGTLADSVKSDLEKAKNAAMSAAKAYADASSSAQAFASSLSSLNLPPGDPLEKAARDPDAQNLLLLGQAAAREEAARASLLAYTISNMRSTIATAMDMAYKAAAMPQETGAAAADKDAAANRDDALREFDQAATTAKQVVASSREGTAPQWLAYTLQAVALHGSYIINGQNQAQYQAAARNALQQNPFLVLTALAPTGNSPAPAPAGNTR